MSRCDDLRAELGARGFDAALIHDPINMRYLTGYTGEGCVLIAREDVVIITDFRYTEQAGRQAPGALLRETRYALPERDIVRELCGQYGIHSLAVEGGYLSYDAHEELARALPGVTLGRAGDMVERLRTVKDAGEIEAICRACRLSCTAFENILPRLHTGMTERQVRLMLDYEMLSLGADGLAFDTIAAAGVNGSLPHAIPSDYVIQKGDLLTLDFGAKWGGYCSDMTRTVGFGRIDGELKRVYDTVYEAHMSALAAVRPGIGGREVDAVARDIIDRVYPGRFGHSTGHGVGLFIHEQPRLSTASTDTLVCGHVVTVEPGVYIPGLGGCRIEDTVILTSDGYIDPVTSPKHLIEL